MSQFDLFKLLVDQYINNDLNGVYMVHVCTNITLVAYGIRDAFYHYNSESLYDKYEILATIANVKIFKHPSDRYFWIYKKNTTKHKIDDIYLSYNIKENTVPIGECLDYLHPMTFDQMCTNKYVALNTRITYGIDIKLEGNWLQYVRKYQKNTNDSILSFRLNHLVSEDILNKYYSNFSNFMPCKLIQLTEISSF